MAFSCFRRLVFMCSKVETDSASSLTEDVINMSNCINQEVCYRTRRDNSQRKKTDSLLLTRSKLAIQIK
ncbi:hypothetical protein DP163_gp129 [Sea otter poxvirus]|uniref:Uncharacterized protein n=1 Tax=Sea otter poxvirus TaxID=1416741 RepID=A0A2U9QHV1_9POXV|nr:hypothetical protein DP163_gp129 [Sea otter poxvirus]AWU47174.1 hypothetical protein [Sea otter poxvirus]